MAVEPDYYEILEVHNRASPEVITKAYRTLAARYHPDLQPPEKKAWAEEQFKLVNRAYQVLADPEQRAQYDRRREASHAAPATTCTTAPPEAPPDRTQAPPRTSAPQYCYRHPEMPRAALCHECGRPICSACVIIAHGYPVCSECRPLPFWHRILPHSGLPKPSGSRAYCLLSAAATVAALGAGLGGAVLCFPVFVGLWPYDPAVAWALGFALVAVAVILVLVLAAVPALDRPGWVPPLGGTAFVVIAIAGAVSSTPWYGRDHASLGEKAFASRAYRAAFVEFSAAAFTVGHPGSTRMSRSYGLSALRLADEECRRGAADELALSRVAVSFAGDITRPEQSKATTDSSDRGESQTEHEIARLYCEDDMLLAEAFSRVSEHVSASGRERLLGEAMESFGLALVSGEVQSVQRADDTPVSFTLARPGRDTAKVIVNLGAYSKVRGRGRVSSPNCIAEGKEADVVLCWDPGNSSGLALSVNVDDKPTETPPTSSANHSPSDSDVAGFYVGAVCCLEVVALWDSPLHRAARKGVEAIDDKVFDERGATKSILGSKSYKEFVGADPGVYRAAADAALEVLGQLPATRFSPEHWTRCSRVVQEGLLLTRSP